MKRKRVFTWHGRKYYYLGTDHNGDNLFLEEARWDCDWYWGGGYIEAFTNNRNPERAKDIKLHTHFDSVFFNKRETGFDVFKKHFRSTPLTDKEIWRLLELMRSFYIARRYSEMLYTGGSNYTENPVKATIVNQAEYDRINHVVIPAIMQAVYEILGGDKE